MPFAAWTAEKFEPFPELWLLNLEVPATPLEAP